MALKIKWLDLQLFAGEGTGGEGGGEGAASGDTSAAAAGQQSEDQRLRELGVPQDVLDKRAKRRSKRTTVDTAARSTAPQQEAAQNAQQTAAATETTEEPTATESTPTRMSWDEIMADPEYNKEMQKVVQSRLRTSKAAEENLSKIAPALELIARQYGLDIKNLDYDALAKAVSDDNQYYEDKALEMGTSIEAAKKADQEQRDTARQQRLEEQTLEQQAFQRHIESLQQQGEALKAVFPNFDLRTELQNPAFARMTAPNVGISVKDAYYAIHNDEIQAAAMQVTAQKTAQQISNSIQAGQRRPAENGTSGQAPSVTTFDYRNASREQREALRKRIYDAQARGEKLYPGQ
jgi:hypothetical protein